MRYPQIPTSNKSCQDLGSNNTIFLQSWKVFHMLFTCLCFVYLIMFWVIDLDCNLQDYFKRKNIYYKIILLFILKHQNYLLQIEGLH